jgi:hypothetical protein
MPEGTDPLFTAINLISWRGYSVQISHQQSLFLLLTDMKSWVRPSSLNSITAAVSMRGLFTRATRAARHWVVSRRPEGCTVLGVVGCHHRLGPHLLVGRVVGSKIGQSTLWVLVNPQGLIASRRQLVRL